MRQFFNSMPRQRALHRLYEARSWFFFPEQSTVVSRKLRMHSFSTLPSIFFLAIIRSPSFFNSVLMFKRGTACWQLVIFVTFTWQ